ncbi:hypothetical protein ACSTK9_23520, partial [Vibrio parahaemolyticus]
QGLAQPLHPAKLADAIRENAQREPQATGLTTSRNIGALPSVRSEAFKSEPAVEAPRRGLRTGGNDDLKRIRGIGVLIEKKL